MEPKHIKIVALVFTHLLAVVMGFSIFYYATQPAEAIWGIFLGNEIQSKASFPRYHMATIYSAWGIGDQQLIFAVNGKRVYRTADMAPGNLKENIIWDETGTVVSFKTGSHTVYKFDTKTGQGTAE